MMAYPEILRGDLHRSPPPGAVAMAFVALFLASMAVPAVMTGGAPSPVPSHPIQDI